MQRSVSLCFSTARACVPLRMPFRCGVPSLDCNSRPCLYLAHATAEARAPSFELARTLSFARMLYFATYNMPCPYGVARVFLLCFCMLRASTYSTHATARRRTFRFEFALSPRWSARAVWIRADGRRLLGVHA